MTGIIRDHLYINNDVYMGLGWVDHTNPHGFTARLHDAVGEEKHGQSLHHSSSQGHWAADDTHDATLDLEISEEISEETSEEISEEILKRYLLEMAHRKYYHIILPINTPIGRIYSIN